MDVGSTFVADRMPPVAAQLRLRTLDHPAVKAQPFAAVHAAPDDVALHITVLPKKAPALREVVYIARMHLLRTLS